MTEKKEYILFVKTGFLKYAPVERTFSSYLEALEFFNKHREMWGAGPKDYLIKSTTELKRETEYKEWKKQQRKAMLQSFKTVAKKIDKLARQLSKPTNSVSRPTSPYPPMKLSIPAIKYGVIHSSIYKQPIITVPTLKPKTVTLKPSKTKPSKEEEVEEYGYGEA